MNYCSWHFVSCYKLRSMSRLVSLSCPDDAMYMSRDWYMDTATTTLRICGTNGTIVFDCQCVSVGPDKLWHYWKSFWNMSTRNQYQGISQCQRRRGPTIQLWSFMASLQVPSDYHTTCVSHLLLSRRDFPANEFIDPIEGSERKKWYYIFGHTNIDRFVILIQIRDGSKAHPPSHSMNLECNLCPRIQIYNGMARNGIPGQQPIHQLCKVKDHNSLQLQCILSHPLLCKTRQFPCNRQ